MKPLPDDRNSYWNERKNHSLYRHTLALAQTFFPNAKTALDVGCYTSGLICEMDWIPRRFASDIDSLVAPLWQDVAGVQFRHGDAFNTDWPEAPFDLVISNQTIEHIDDAAGFAEKLLSLGRGLIISTTYETPFGLIPGHVQDPISLEKFARWFGCEWDSYTICLHPSRAIKHVVAVFKDRHPNR